MLLHTEPYVGGIPIFHFSITMMLTVTLFTVAASASLSNINTNTATATATATAPTGLLADFQKTTATGVRAAPVFSWIVPPCGRGSDHVQTAYNLVVTDGDGKKVWDSGEVQSNESTSVKYGGSSLQQGTPYTWTVTTWTAAAAAAAAAAGGTPASGAPPCQSSPSYGLFTEPSLF